MNKKNLFLSALLFIGILPFALFSSCDKDTHCYLAVHVLDESTREPIPNAKVVVYQNGGSLHSEGVTGTDGIYRCNFRAPAILSIKATLDVEFGERRGETSVRLREGEVIDANVTMSSQIY